MIRSAWTGYITKSPATVLTVLMAVILVVLVFIAWMTGRAHESEEEVVNRTFTIEQVRGSILYLDELRSLSARMAVITGDLSWALRHNEVESQLQAALQEAAELDPQSWDAERIREANDVNRTLFDMENRALELLRAGRGEDAAAVLSSADYERQRELYANGIAALSIALADEVAFSRDNLDDYDAYSEYAVGVVMLLVLVCWAVASVSLRRWQTALLEANQTLEQRVEQRTEELQDSNRQLHSEISQRNQVEQALVAARQRQHHLLASSPAVIYALKVAKEPVATFLSDNVRDLLGYESSEFMSGAVSWPDSIHPDDHDRALAGFAQAMEAGRAKMQYRLRHKNGTYRWVHDAMLLIRDENGEPTEIVGSATDITEQKRIEEEVKESWQRYAGILDIAPDAVISFAEDQRIQLFNKGAERIFGYATDEILGRPFEELVPASLRETQRTYIEDFASSPEPNRPLARGAGILGLNKGGAEFPVEGSISKLKTASGWTFTVMLRDISARVEAEAQWERMERELRAGEQRYRDLVEGSVQGILIHRNLKPVFVNKTWADIHGYTVDEIMSMESILPMISPNEREKMAGFNDARLEGEAVPQTYEYQALRKNGNLVWCENRARIVTWEGEPAIQATIVDISARKQAEAERAEMEGELRQAQKLEALGTLSGGIAHEINTPVQYIGDNVRFLKDGFADLGTVLGAHKALVAAAKGDGDLAGSVTQAETVARDADLDFLADEIPTAIDQCLEGVQRVTEIVRAIKEFSHPDAKEKSAVDINHAIATTITVTRNQWKYVAELETDFDTSLPPVWCLAGEFNQVILNLIVNAAHAIEAAGREEGGRITISTRQDEGWVEIRVTDNGTGMPEEIREQIFNPFFTTKEPGKGTGQGLAIAHTIVTKKHGGVIAVESEVGQGTTFIMCLPITATNHSYAAE